MKFNQKQRNKMTNYQKQVKNTRVKFKKYEIKVLELITKCVKFNQILIKKSPMMFLINF